MKCVSTREKEWSLKFKVWETETLIKILQHPNKKLDEERTNEEDEKQANIRGNNRKSENPFQVSRD